MKLKKFLIRSGILSLTLMFSFTSVVSGVGLPDLQKKVLQSGAKHFNVEESFGCGPGLGSNPGGSLAAGSSLYMLGDSITMGATQRYRAAFTAKGITPYINANGGRAWTYEGSGASGNYTPEAGGAQKGSTAVEVDGEQIANSDGIVIALGSNDSLGANPIGDIIAAVKLKNPDAPIWWVNVVASDTNTVPTAASYGEFNAALSAQAQDLGYSIINWHGAVLPDGNPSEAPTRTVQDPNDFLADDGLHLKAAGNDALVALVVGSLTTASTGSGPFTTTWGGNSHTLAAEWIPILDRAAARFDIDSAFLAGIMSIESNWQPPSFYADNPLRNSATATGAFQIIDLTASSLMPMPDQWIDTLYGGDAGTGDNGKNIKSRPFTSNTVKAVMDGQDKEDDGSYIVDGNKDTKVDRGTPEDSAFMAAAYLKSMQAAVDTPLGDAGDYAVARNNQDGKVTIRTIAAHYNQGGGYDNEGATTAAEANSHAIGGNDVAKYMDQVMTVTEAARASGLFGHSAGSFTPGCNPTPATGNASEYIADCNANNGNAAIACTAINQLIGIPYNMANRAAPTDPNPQFLDCSALTSMAVYRAFGVNLGSICSVDYLSNDNFEVIDVHDIQPGDMVGKGADCVGSGGKGHIGVVVSYNSDTRKLITVEASSSSHPSGLRGIGGEHGYNVGLVADGNGTYEWAVRYVGDKTLQPGAN
jgi:lysophospholipase L1-like esterase